MRRDFELLFYVTFGAGLAFGTSSFTILSGLFEATAGIWVVAAIVLAGVCCIGISASIAELASMYPGAPGVRTYLKVALPSFVSLELVYLYLAFMVLIAGVESYMFALVVRAVFPALPVMPVALALLGFTVAINLLGVEIPRAAQVVATLGLIGIVIVVGLAGIAAGRFDVGRLLTDGAVVPEPVKLLPGAVGLAIYLFVGFEWVTMLGFGPESYKRLIPVSMPLAILVLTIMYSLLAVGFGLVLTRREIAATPIPQVPYLLALGGALGPLVAWVLSLLAIFCTLNAGIMGGSRLIHALTREGTLPSWCATISLRTGAPVGSLLLLGALAMLSAVVIVTFELQLVAAVIGACIVSFVYAAFMLAALLLRRRQPTLGRPFRTPVPPLVQWLAVFVLPILGVLGLFSEAGSVDRVLAGALSVVAGVSVLARWSLGRLRRKETELGRLRAARRSNYG